MKIKSTRIYLEEGLRDTCIEIENGCFKCFCEADENTYDFDNKRIIPGIIDTHNHGLMGYAMRCSADENALVKQDVIRGYLKALVAYGVVGVFPTCCVNMIKEINMVRKEQLSGAKILGIHVEGPWLNRVGEKGIKKELPLPSLEVAKKMIADGGGNLKLVAISPEIEGIDIVIHYFEEAKINLSLAHSDNDYASAVKALTKYNYSSITHLGNAMSGLHHRDVGTFGAALLNTQLACELICDFTHVCKEMLIIIFKLKSLDLIMLISDNSEYSLLPSGAYKASDEECIINVTSQGTLIMESGKIQGSYFPVLKGIENLVECLEMPMEDVLKMSSYNAARHYDLVNRGSITLGNYADFVVLDDDYSVLKTYIEGVCVYDKKENPSLVNEEFINRFKI